ncbi:DUF305 domain-containing protein [Cellulomonas sp. NS3]|uniref:DUF305 domain-containing protein n=1 Tax=Cellulomonas sp. NS3 TaxID=2973977 RepID=UPI002161598A|nr:DUF305 domain-containing protein [Cellulomonas sp. NS3]
MRPTRRRVTAAAAALTLATLAACSGQSDPAATEPADQETTASETADAAAHNEADTEFAQMMIAHHQGAIEMAQMAAEKATNPEVQALAERIEAAQDPEIEQMTGWLEAWGEETTAMDHGGMDHGGMQMDGMDQEQAMSELAGLEGAAFDQRFLELMTAHHEGAVAMAEQQLEEGENADALQLARKIIDDQTVEITEMQNLLSAS